MVASLARVFDLEAMNAKSVPLGQLTEIRQRRGSAVWHANAAVEAGYRRVVEDDDTIERLARAVSQQAIDEHDGPIDGLAWDEDTEESRETFRWLARAAVRALREGA